MGIEGERSHLSEALHTEVGTRGEEERGAHQRRRLNGQGLG